MSKKMKMVEVSLTDEQIAEIDAADGNPPLQQQILERIAGEAARQHQAEAIVDDILDQLMATGIERDKVKVQFLTDVLLNVHHLMHDQCYHRAMQMLCPMAAILQREDVPDNVMIHLAKEINALNAERLKSDCEGSA